MMTIDGCTGLLRSLDPVLRDGTYVFCSVSGEASVSVTGGAIGMFLEDEGRTLILPVEIADEAGLQYESTFRMITLRVLSSLEAVGLTAAVATALAEERIAANVVAAYHHDHVFVPSERAEDAVSALRTLQERARGGTD